MTDPTPQIPSPEARVAEAISPVRPDNKTEAPRVPEKGTGLCLSGGGYRAMLFHAGVLWRLNEMGVLRELKRISSVSGGSIAAGVLGLRWKELTWETRQMDGRTIQVATNFQEKVVEPIQGLARHTVDGWSIVEGVVLPWKSISDEVEAAYRKHLFGKATLQDLPSDAEGPRFVINATNVQSGVLWRFMKPYMADYRVGRVDNPTISLALAVTASSAFPPVLSPARMKLPAGLVRTQGGEDLHREPYTTDVFLTDGGVYDNLGLEAVWKSYDTVLVSDGGGQMEAELRPHSDWARHALRVNDLIDNQVRSLRKRQVVGSLVARERKGAYWRTRSDIRDFPASKTLECPLDRTTKLAEIGTRLEKMDRVTQERLINWGYAISDAGVRGWMHEDLPGLPAPSDFPFPASKV
jgi:NTE family protein